MHLSFPDASQYFEHNPDAYIGKEEDVVEMALRNQVSKYLAMDIEQEAMIHEMVRPMEHILFGDSIYYDKYIEYLLGVSQSTNTIDMIDGPDGCVCSTCQDMNRITTVWDDWNPTDKAELYIKRIVDETTLFDRSRRESILEKLHHVSA